MSARRLPVAAAVAVLSAAGALALATAGSAGGGAGSWGALAPSPLERTEVGAARIGDRIYVVGGYISSGGTTDRLLAYDISADQWRELRALPIAVNHAGVAAMDGRLYVHGGNLPGGAGDEPKSRRLYRYDPGRDRWRRLPDAPTARAAHGLVAIGSKLYAAGGYSDTDTELRTLEVYDSERRSWRRGPPMPTGRNHVGAVATAGPLGRLVVVTGGRPGPVTGNQATVEAYDPKRRRWRTLPPLGTPRSGHAAVFANGRIVVLGGEELGEGGATIEQVERLDRRGRRWEALPDMVTPRHGLGAAARGGRVYALEGGPRPGLTYSGALELLDLGG